MEKSVPESAFSSDPEFIRKIEVFFAQIAPVSQFESFRRQHNKEHCLTISIFYKFYFAPPNTVEPESLTRTHWIRSFGRVAHPRSLLFSQIHAVSRD